MTHKILNGKRLKADKKERQTTDNSSIRHFIWLTRLMPPATLEQQTTTRLSRTFPTKTLDTKCKRNGDKRRWSKRRSTDLFFVWCRQTMVWYEQTMVWYEQTMVWRRQTIKRRHPNKQTKRCGDSISSHKWFDFQYLIYSSTDKNNRYGDDIIAG